MRNANLEAMINELEGHVPRMFRDYSDEAGFWLWFSGEADSMRRFARSTEERHYVCDRMNQMLQRTGVARQLVE
jgi:hypothetical protein